MSSPWSSRGTVRPWRCTCRCTSIPQSVVFLDDCDAMFRILPALGILRSALWEGEKGSRLGELQQQPAQGAVVLPLRGADRLRRQHAARPNYAFQAVLARVDQFELSASNEEVLEMMRRLAAQGFEGKLTADECQEVVDFVSEFSATRELSLRLLEPSLKKVLYAREEGVDWRQLVASQLHEIGRTAVPKVPEARAYDLECLKQVLSPGRCLLRVAQLDGIEPGILFGLARVR